MESGKIVILNGTSSSGKSSILKALQNLLPEPYLDAGIDKFIWMLPSRYLDPPLWDDVLGKAVEAGAAGHQLIRAMHRSISEISRAGFNVLADHVLVEPDWVQDCAEVFHGLPAYLSGIHCPLEILEEREMHHRDRTLGQARAQFDRVHSFADYDFEIDTSKACVDVCAQQIAEFLVENRVPTALRKKAIHSRSSFDPS